MANNRIFYAVQQVGFRPDGAADATNFTALHGVQSVGMTTNFNLSQVFELGQISIYENIEDIPDVEVSLTKVLDSRLSTQPLLPMLPAQLYQVGKMPRVFLLLQSFLILMTQQKPEPSLIVSVNALVCL